MFWIKCQKCLVLVLTSYSARSYIIKPMNTSNYICYLGLEFNWKGKVTPKRTSKLQNWVDWDNQSTPKPYQQLELLRSFETLRTWVPKLILELVLGNVHCNTLKKMDILVRSETRHLPKDTRLAICVLRFKMEASIYHVFVPQSPCSKKCAIVQFWMVPAEFLNKQRKMFNAIKWVLNLPFCIWGLHSLAWQPDTFHRWQGIGYP